jgi:PTS system nitrogen regulatory IIA component
LGWLINHLSSTLALLRDAGVREICEILVIPQPGPHDVLVASTAERLGAAHDARIVFARFVHDDADGLEAQSEADYLEQVSVLCGREHRTIVLHGKDEVAAITAASVQYDLLVLGASGDRRLKHILWPPVEDRVMREAACSTLVLRRPRELVHEALTATDEDARREADTLRELITPELLEARLEVADKSALFHAIAEHLARVSGNTDVESIERALLDREETQNTAVGHGVALPHATLHGATRTYLGIFTVREPLDYDAPDGGLVDVLFVTLGPPSDRNHHLRVLAAIAHRIHETDLLGRVRAAEDRAGLSAAIEACDDLP